MFAFVSSREMRGISLDGFRRIHEQLKREKTLCYFAVPLAERPRWSHRLAWPRTEPSQGSDTGSNPVGTTTCFRHLPRSSRRTALSLWRAGTEHFCLGCQKTHSRKVWYYRYELDEENRQWMCGFKYLWLRSYDTNSWRMLVVGVVLFRWFGQCIGKVRVTTDTLNISTF